MNQESIDDSLGYEMILEFPVNIGKSGRFSINRTKYD